MPSEIMQLVSRSTRWSMRLSRSRVGSLLGALALAACSNPTNIGEPSALVGQPLQGDALLYESTEDHIDPGQILGTNLGLWMPGSMVDRMRTGLATSGYRYFRFPGGSESDVCHWNGDPRYFTSAGVWDATAWDRSLKLFHPGVSTRLRYRGTTQLPDGASNLTDGDLRTEWRTDPSIRTPARVILELSGRPFQKVVLRWSQQFPMAPAGLRYRVQTSSAEGALGASQNIPDSQWWDAPVTPVYDSGRGTTTLTLNHPSHDTRLRIEVSRGPLFGASIPPLQEVEVLDSQSGFVSIHDKDPTAQTFVYAAPTSPASDPHPSYEILDFESFMDFVNHYSHDAEPVICVNYGTGTPPEAAAWVEYANIVQGYGIKYWQIGNEMHGAWEEGGPVSARMYAERFVAFAQAMKAVDSTIRVLGPSYSTAVTAPDSQDNDGVDRNYLEAFLAHVAQYERDLGERLLDGIDVHRYPYWTGTPDGGDIQKMLDDQRPVAHEFALMHTWIDTYLDDPATRSVHLTEYGTNAGARFAGLDSIANAAGTANVAASFASEFGARAHLNQFAALSGDPQYIAEDPNNYGDFMLFAYPLEGVTSSFDLAPAGTYWGPFMLGRIWLDPAQANQLLRVSGPSTSQVRAFAVRTPDAVRVLLINLSDTLQTVRAGELPEEWEPQEAGFVYTETDREYSRSGTDLFAAASPNAGPSSTPIARATPVELAPRSIAVVVYPLGGASPSADAPEIVHWGAVRSLAKPGVEVSGSVLSSAPLTQLELAWDGKTFAPIVPLDGALDGSAEAVAVATAGVGCLEPVLRATNASGATTQTLHVRDAFAMNRAIGIDDFQDGDTGTELQGWWGAWSWPNGSASVSNVLDPRSLSRVATVSFTGVTGDSVPGLSSDLTMPLRVPPIDGLRLRARCAQTNHGLVVKLKTTDFPPDEYGFYEVALPALTRNFQTFAAAITDFTQPVWSAVQFGPLDPRKINGIEIRLLSDVENGRFDVDDIELVACP